MTRAKPKLLFVGHLPPPLHGVSLANQRLLDGGPLHEAFEIRTLAIGAKSMKEVAQAKGLRLGAAARAGRSFARLARAAGKADLVYFTPGLFGAAVLRDASLAELCAARKTPYVLHLHSGRIGYDWQGRPAGAVVRSALQRMLSRAASVLLLHDCFRASFAEYLDPQTPCPSVLNGVPLPPAAPLEEQPLRLGFVGNMQPIKGFHLALELLAQLPGLELEVVGGFATEDYEAEVRQRLARLDLSGRVHFHGPKAPSEVWQPLESCPVLIFPSHVQEGLPLVWLEAMVRGKAVMSFEVGCAKEELGDLDPASVHPRGDVASMIAGLSAWQRDPARLLELRRRGFERGRERFSLPAWQARVTQALLAALD